MYSMVSAGTTESHSAKTETRAGTPSLKNQSLRRRHESSVGKAFSVRLRPANRACKSLVEKVSPHRQSKRACVMTWKYKRDAAALAVLLCIHGERTDL